MRCCAGWDSKPQPVGAKHAAASTAARERERLSEEHSKARESSPAGALKVFAVDLPATAYKRAARSLEVFTTKLRIAYKRLFRPLKLARVRNAL